MRNKTSPSFPLLLISVSALACSLFTGGARATRTEAPEFEPVAAPLIIEPESLPNAQIGEKYEALIRIAQNVTPVGDMYISNGSLPAGLELTFMQGEDSAVIGGTATEAGTYSFTLSVWCFGTQVSGQTLDKEYTIIVE
ncbi:MAG: hypothetical protein DYG85_00155 [Chloroflexi bacterium CFX1]|nr:hypothetical protein [Chloroflexi bacterium CFX1]MCQ3951891.1 hypothetical protein [Chloroflexota bacterium]MDL1917744.1 hypothetical protein [Chloroflexi bacterium CFX5]NUQ58299.1 hypothetical protein [Anaerolineales bacterium]